MCHFWVQNAPFVLNKKWSVKIVIIISIYILNPFSMQIFKKLLRGDPELWQWTISGSKLVHLPLTRTFLGKLLILFSSTYWTLSLCKILKNSYNGSRVIRMCHFWTQNRSICPNEFFFQKSLVPIIHAYLHPKRILKSHWPRVTFGFKLRILFLRGM